MVVTSELAAGPASRPASSKAHEQAAAAVGLVHLEVEVTPISEANFFTGLEEDIAHGGLFLSTYLALKIGTPVTISLTVAGVPVHVRGVIRWKRPGGDDGWPPGIGIAFDEVTAASRATIETFFRRRPPLYYELED